MKLNSTMRVARPEQRHGYRYRRFISRAQRKAYSRSKNPVILQTGNCTRAKEQRVAIVEDKAGEKRGKTVPLAGAYQISRLRDR